MIDRIVNELRSRPRLKKGLVAAAVFFVVFTVTGFLILPPVVRWALVKNLSETLHRQVTIETVRINPFRLSVVVRGFDVREKDGGETFVSFDELLVNLQSLSLFKKGFVIKEVRLLKPHARIIRKNDLSYNFSDLLPQKGEESAAELTEPLYFSINNIRIQDARIDFSDRPKQTDHALRDGNLTIPFISNRPAHVETFVKPDFSAEINGKKVAFSGDTKLFADSLETTLGIDLRDVDIPHYLAYSPVPMDYRVVSGRVSTTASISYIQHQKKEPVLRISGSAGLREFEIRDLSDNRMVRLPAVDISIADLQPLAARAHLSEVQMRNPEVVVARDKTGSLNLQALLPHPMKTAAEGPAPAGSRESAFLFTIDRARIVAGKAAFHDSAKGRLFSSTLSPLELTADHLTNVPETAGKIDVSARSEADEALRVQADLTLNPLRIAGTASATGLLISKYAHYYGDAILFDMPKGRLDLSTAFRFDESKGVLTGASAAITSLTAVKRGEADAFLTVPNLTLADTDVDFLQKDMRLGSISTGKGRVKIVRSKGGGVNVASLFPPSQVERGTGKPPANTADTKTAWLSALAKVFAKNYAEPARPWLVELRDAAVDDYVLSVEDLVPAERADIDIEKVAIRVKDLSTGRGKKGRVTLSFVVDRRGYVASKGTVSINPIAADVRLDTKKIPVISFQPYFTDTVKIYVSDGHVSSAGDLSFDYTKAEGPRISYRGEASLYSFASVDKVNGDDFVKWESLHLGGLDLRTKPLRIKIGETALTDFYARVIINSDATLNLQQAIGTGEQEETASSGEGGLQKKAGQPKGRTPGLIEIDKVTLQGGTVNFTDNYIKPNFSANFVELAGRVTGLSSRQKTTADVDLKGKLNNYAPLEITGRLNPFREALFVDLTTNFSDIDLSPASPYSGKYLGYGIEKGKLSMNLQYLVVQRRLESQNKVFLDQLTLGEQVESPQATKLPVRLAIALLKNRKGEINLDLPVSGSLDDPEFSLGSVILKMLMNILVKASTAPFALLGAIFGSGEELSYVEFDYGSSVISDQAARKLDTLIKALHERPSLRLEIEGRVHPEKDAEGLRQQIFDRKVKTQKFRSLVKKGESPPSVEEVTIGKDEYPEYLQMAYKEETFPKPRNHLGFAKDLPPAEMEKLMLTNIVVREDDLRSLGRERAQVVKDYLLRSKQVEPERVFLVEPKSLGPEKKDTIKESRVAFRLK